MVLPLLLLQGRAGQYRVTSSRPSSGGPITAMLVLPQGGEQGGQGTGQGGESTDCINGSSSRGPPHEEEDEGRQAGRG